MANNQDVEMGGASASSIQYGTFHNQLASQKAGKDMNVAHVYTHKTYTLKELAAALKARGVSLTRGTIFYVLQELADLMQDLLAEGNAINLGGIVRLFPTIRGTFEEGETFDESKHAIVVRAIAGKVVRGAASAGPVQKVGGSVSPTITGLYNTVNFEEDILFGGGETGTVEGKFLTFDATAADEGLFISCPEYEGDDLTLDVLKSDSGAIKFKVNGAIDAEYTAFVTFATRGGDKNAEVTEIKREVTLKPAVG